MRPSVRAPTPRSWLNNTVTTVLVAVTVGASCVAGLALALSFVRAAERGLLLGACGAGAPPRARA